MYPIKTKSTQSKSKPKSSKNQINKNPHANSTKQKQRKSKAKKVQLSKPYQLNPKPTSLQNRIQIETKSKQATCNKLEPNERYASS